MFDSESESSSARLLAPNRHIMLSPHYDDIALSLGGTAASLAEAGKTPTVAILFGAEPDPVLPLTSFAEKLHRQWGLPATEVIAKRRREEEAAAAVLGVSPRYLPFRDAIYRGDRYTSNAALFGDRAADEVALPGEIAGSLELTSSDVSGTRVYAPLGIGRHVDHQTAFAAGAELAGAGWEVWFYEDMPYALKSGAPGDRLKALEQQYSSEIAAVIDVEETWTTKINAILSYPSQLRTVFAYVEQESSREVIEAVMSEYARSIGLGRRAERLWRLITSANSVVG